MNDVEVVENWQSLIEDEISFDNKFTRANPTKLTYSNKYTL